MPDLLNDIDRRIKYLDRYLPQTRQVTHTHEQRMDMIRALISRAEAGLATNPDPEKHDRIMEILRVGRERFIKLAENRAKGANGTK